MKKLIAAIALSLALPAAAFADDKPAPAPAPAAKPAEPPPAAKPAEPAKAPEKKDEAKKDETKGKDAKKGHKKPAATSTSPRMIRVRDTSISSCLLSIWPSARKAVKKSLFSNSI